MQLIVKNKCLYQKPENDKTRNQKDIAETAVIVFHRSGRLLNESKSFLYGEQLVTSAHKYTYLGGMFTLNGSFKTTQENLRQRVPHVYFSLRSMINLNLICSMH
jgi:hypothetical protein